jgi:hypothetical protein
MQSFVPLKVPFFLRLTAKKYIWWHHPKAQHSTYQMSELEAQPPRYQRFSAVSLSHDFDCNMSHQTWTKALHLRNEFSGPNGSGGTRSQYHRPSLGSGNLDHSGSPCIKTFGEKETLGGLERWFSPRGQDMAFLLSRIGLVRP